MRKIKKTHLDVLKEIHDPENWKPITSKIARKLNLPISTVNDIIRKLGFIKPNNHIMERIQYIIKFRNKRDGW